MARISLNILTISIFLSSISFLATTGKENDNFRTSTTTFKRKPLKEKLTHFTVYWHDILSGNKPTTVQIVKPPSSKNPNAFGQISMIDNPLTVKPELNSTVVGKSQGFYALASQEEIGLLMAMNFVFTQGKYNGSTISILGRNAVFDQVREMPVIGGSGLFRFARGYAQARTHNFDLKTGDATVKYDVYVIHY